MGPRPLTLSPFKDVTCGLSAARDPGITRRILKPLPLIAAYSLTTASLAQPVIVCMPPGYDPMSRKKHPVL